MIHEVALPQTMSTMSLRADAQPFQKCSSAGMNPDRWVSIQGSSSIKTIFFGSLDCRIISLRASKASSQVWGRLAFLSPYSRRERRHAASCFFMGDLARPVW